MVGNPVIPMIAVNDGGYLLYTVDGDTGDTHVHALFPIIARYSLIPIIRVMDPFGVMRVMVYILSIMMMS